jgi:hypothetical protein
VHGSMIKYTRGSTIRKERRFLDILFLFFNFKRERVEKERDRCWPGWAVCIYILRTTTQYIGRIQDNIHLVIRDYVLSFLPFFIFSPT